MSHHDDNLYTILGKLAALQPKPEIKTSKEAAKKIYESVEARGSILSGVDAVQNKLAKQFAETTTNEAVRVAGNTKGVTPVKIAEETCNECGMYESKCKCDHTNECSMCESGTCTEHGMSEGGKTSKQYWNRDSQSIGSTPDDGLTYADPDEDGVHYPDYGNTKFQPQPQAKSRPATSANKRLTDKQYAKQLHKTYAPLYDTLRITFNRRKDIFSVTGDNGAETDYIKYRVDPLTNKLKKMMSTSVENESVNPGMAEASYINGKEEDPKSLRWKQTSMTPQQAITKYGKENVRVTRGGLRNGDDMVEVKVALGEQGMAEGEKVVKGNVTTHKGTYGTEYQGDPDEEDGKVVKAPKVSNSKTGKRGRPTKDAAPVYTNSNDPFGRSSLPKTKVKGKVHKMDETMTQLELQLLESVTLDEGGVTFQHILATFKRDVKDFEEGGDMSDHLYDALYDYYFDDMPYGTQKARDGDPYEWVADRFGADLGIDGYGGNSPSVPDDDYSLERESIDPTNPRDYEIPAYQRKAQGQAPLTARDIMQKDKKPEHDFYQRRTGEVHPDAMQRELNELAKLAGLSEDCGDMSPIGSAMQDMHDEQDNLSISTTYNSRDGKKTISVNADGEQAEALLQMLRIAGLGGGEAAQQAQSRVIAVAEPDQEIEVDEADAPVDDAGANPVNAPKPEYKTMRQSTMNPGEGDGGEKAMHPDRPTFKNGDNALAKPANESVGELEASLAAEYESIKKVN